MLEDIKSWAGLLGTALGIGSLLFTWITARSAANSKTLEVHGDELTAHDRRIQAVEAELKHAPRKEDVHALKVSIVALEGTVKAQSEKLDAAIGLVRNIDVYLKRDSK